MNHRNQIMAAKRTLDFVLAHPEGVTREDFEKAGIQIVGIEKLQKMKLIKAFQIKEPERGPRAYHWFWISYAKWQEKQNNLEQAYEG